MNPENQEIKRAVDIFIAKMSTREWSYEARQAAMDVFEPSIEDAFEGLGFENATHMAARAAMIAKARLNMLN